MSLITMRIQTRNLPLTSLNCTSSKTHLHVPTLNQNKKPASISLERTKIKDHQIINYTQIQIDFHITKSDQTSKTGLHISKLDQPQKQTSILNIYAYLYTFTYFYIHTHIYTYICMCVYIHTYAYMYMCVYTHMYICMHLYIHTHIYVSIYTPSQAHIHTY